jgi:hypothetical protein
VNKPGGDNGLAVCHDVIEKMGAGDTRVFGQLIDVLDGLHHGITKLDVGERAGMRVFEL